MFGECHAHIALNGIDYRAAKRIHENGPDDSIIRQTLECYQSYGIGFIRDGGDAFGVSRRASEIAPEYGIDLRTPIFAIHKKGYYGNIIGRGFDKIKEYAALVEEAAAQGANFIKIMTTGIMDFKRYGAITSCDALSITVARNFIDAERNYGAVLEQINQASQSAIRLAFEAGVTLALGSDAGAVGVSHGQGVLNEYRCFIECIADEDALIKRLCEGEAFIKNTFKRRAAKKIQ